LILTKSKTKEAQKAQKPLQTQQILEMGTEQEIKADILQIDRVLILISLPEIQEESRAQAIDETQAHQQKVRISRQAQVSKHTQGQEVDMAPGTPMEILEASSEAGPEAGPEVGHKIILKEILLQTTIIRALKGIHLCGVGHRRLQEEEAASQHHGKAG
jgi:hypothetical protein